MGTGPTGTGTTTGASGSSGPTLPSVSASHMKTAAASTFSMPLGTNLEVLSGQNWLVWSGVLKAILQLNDVDAILHYSTLPSGVNTDNWETIQKKTMAYLRIYCTTDVFSTVESDTDFSTFKAKFDRLWDTYGGVGSTAVFNLWIKLTQA